MPAPYQKENFRSKDLFPSRVGQGHDLMSSSLAMLLRMSVFLLTCLHRTILAAPPAWDFTGKAGVQGWDTFHHLDAVSPSAEGLRFRVSGDDPYLVSPAANFASKEPVFFFATLRSAAEGWGQVFFFKDVATEAQALHFRVRTGWNEIALPLPPLGEGWRLRVDFPAGKGECVLARLGVEEVGARGVIAVTAEADVLHLRLGGLAETVEVVEILPHQSLDDWATAPVVWKGEVPARSELVVSRRGGERDRIYSRFLAVIPHPRRGRIPAGTARQIEDVSRISRDTREFPAARNKKGLQFQDVEDALALGIGHATINVSYGALLDLENQPDNPKWQLDGRTYSFNRRYLESLPVKRLSSAGVNVYFILLAYRTGREPVDALTLHPGHDRPLPNGLAAFNTVTAEGAQTFRATVEFLADRFCRAGDEHGRVAGFIVGNEVNAHRQWYNFGRLPAAPAVAEYERALRLAHTAVRTASAQARVYASFTHHWTERASADELGSKFFLDHLTRLARLGGEYDWRIAYHPYPENLFEPRVWKDVSARPDFATPKITFKNLEVLPAYLARPEMRYRGEPRTVLLSEQGFHSNNTPVGDQAQAAAYCYAWEKVARLPTVEAFILHRHVDHKFEGGLNLGLWRRLADSTSHPDTRRPIYDCFKAAGTPAQTEAFRFALPIVGLKQWDEVQQLNTGH